jgi:hypothetical protein
MADSRLIRPIRHAAFLRRRWSRQIRLLSLHSSRQRNANLFQRTNIMSKTHNISVNIHGILDYLTGLLLVTSPLFLHYPGNASKLIAYAAGGAVLAYSIMTDYPPALLRFLPFPVHRTFDFFAGFALLFSPIEFTVGGLPAVLFVILGLSLIAMAFMTRGQFSHTGRDQPIVPGA